MRKKLEWYAFIIDFNSNKIKYINVLSESIVEQVKKKLKKCDNLTFNKVKEELTKTLMSVYWSRVEYEVIVKNLFKDEGTKIDVWFQLEPNIDRITEYFIANTKLNIKEK